MDNNLRIPDIYPVNLSKTITLKVSNIAKHDGTPKGYSFEVECNDAIIIKFDQSMSVDLSGSRIVLNASTGLARYRRMVDSDPMITGCVGLMPPGNRLLECFITDAYRQLMDVLFTPVRNANIVVKWPEKEE